METHLVPPWERYGPDVSGERLAAVAAIIVEARRAKAAARTHRDWGWNFGCDGYVWILDDLISGGEGEYADWLRMTPRGVLDAELRFGASCKFVIYRANANGQPGRTLRVDREVADQMTLEIEVPVALAADPRIAYWTDDEGLVTAVTVQHLNLDGDVEYEWPVFVRDKSVVGFGTPRDAKGVDIEAPDPQLGEDVDAAADERDEDAERG